MPDLHSELTALANSFANAVLAAIRSASLQDLMAESGAAAPVRAAGRRARTPAAPPAPAPRATRAVKPGARLARRSPADIEKALDRVVTALKAAKERGLRSEEIQKAAGLERRELPRVLKSGLAKKVLRSKGQKRATTYYSA
jgi:hypothetical protein